MASSVPAATLPADSIEAATAARLRYVSDRAPGIARVRRGSGFGYRAADGAPVRDPETIARIRALAIPPAWTSVWICPSPTGHIQAVGRDARGRKQYRYHARWREVRDETKYARLIQFGRALPGIRRRVQRDLAPAGLPREKVLATVVRLLETTLIRVGNEEYARDNRSYGLTTLRTKHVRVTGPRLRFEFRGKGGKPHLVDVSDRRLARIVQQCQELPGHELFQYVDESGRATGHRLVRHQRVSQRHRRPRLHGEGLSHVGRHRAGGDDAAGDGHQGRTADQEARHAGGGHGRGTAAEHTDHLPEVLHPSRRADVVPRIDARATAHRGRTREASVATGAAARGARGAEAPQANVRATPPLGAATS